jgi:hypothetical protein
LLFLIVSAKPGMAESVIIRAPIISVLFIIPFLLVIWF